MFDFEVCHICGDNDQEANILGDGRFAICDSCDNTFKQKAMKSDWLVRTYDSFENQIYQWVIRDRSEHEAESEAMHSVEVRDSHDWSMTKLSAKEEN